MRLHRPRDVSPLVVENLIAEAYRVVTRWRMSRISTRALPNLPPAGTPEDGGIIVVFRMAKGKIVERWAAHRR